MSKKLKFPDPHFYGINFRNKYEAYRTRILTEAGYYDLGEIIPTLTTIIGLEGKHRVLLTQLAIQTCKNMFPLIVDVGMKFDVAIEDNISHKSISPEGAPKEPEPLPDDKEEEELNEIIYKKAAKHKTLNAFGQGAAVSMNTVHHMVDELDTISINLKPLYDKLMRLNEIAYLTMPEEDFVQMAQDCDDNEMIGGTNRIIWDENGFPVVVARGVNFVTLVHEIVKGIYTYLALNAYESEYEYYEIAQYTESIASEIEDIGAGKMIISTLRDYLLDNFDSYYVHESFFEMFIVALAKLPPDEMLALMNGLISDTPNRSKFEALARDCYHELKAHDKNKLKF